MQKISFVIPCYRSEQTIGHVIDEIRAQMQNRSCDYEIVAVNDCSPDRVFDVLSRMAQEDEHIKVISFAKNFGQHSAMMAGVRFSTGDVIVFLDDDGQCPLEELGRLLAPLSQGADVAIARYGVKAQSLFKNFGSLVNEVAANLLIDKPKDIQMGNFMAFRRFVADEMLRYHGPYPYISGLLFRSSARVVNVPMKELPRLAGGTTYTLTKLVSLWVSSFTAFSVQPLRVATFIGILSAIVGILLAAFIVARKILHPEIAVGWSSLMSIGRFSSGLIMFMLGIIGEYVGRIYLCLSDTPQYVIRDTVNIDRRSDGEGTT